MNLANAKKDLRRTASPAKGKFLQRFFKCGPGEYAEGDIFLGVVVPETRKIAKRYFYLKFPEIAQLMKSKIHEERLLGLCILIGQFESAEEKDQKKYFDFYIKNRRGVNNWDLVDCSAGDLAGVYLFKRPKNILYKFARSKDLWEKRIAIIATLHFIRENRYADTLKIAKILLNDDHDLIHKAVGWMLREVGKRNLKVEESFLKKNYKKMPRTMLRYAIEKFPEPKRKRYLRGKV